MPIIVTEINLNQQAQPPCTVALLLSKMFLYKTVHLQLYNSIIRIAKVFERECNSQSRIH